MTDPFDLISALGDSLPGGDDPTEGSDDEWLAAADDPTEGPDDWEFE